jgi:hypothetical protein
MKRHPDISERTASTLGHQRAIVNQAMIANWFQNLTTYLKTEVDDWERLVGDPKRFFNADESGFPLCVNTGKVLAEKGVRHVYQVTSSNKQQITVMACFNACGDYVPPLIVYPGQRYRDTGIGEFPDAIYGMSDNGWMDSQLFLSFLHHLDVFIGQKQIQRPVILFVDGHSTHMSLDAAQFCYDHQIILYCLLENATYVLQPCDVGFFGPLKSAWKRQVKSWHTEHLGQTFTKKQFPGVFRKCWEDVSKIENAIHGFKRCGLFPLNPENIDQSKLHPSEIHVSVGSRGDEGSSKEKHCSAPSENGDQPVSATNASAETLTKSSASLPGTVGASPVTSAAHTLPIQSQQQNEGSVRVVQTGREHQVSESFALLRVPELTPKNPVKRLRSKLPKALSGQAALQMLKDREIEKVAQEDAKRKRKEEREQRKKDKEEEKERKRKIREEEKQKKQEARRLKEIVNAQRKRRADSTSSSDSERDVHFVESDDNLNDDAQCPGCDTDDGDPSEWVACTKCPRKWHISCTGDAILCEIPTEQIAQYPFICELCM